MSDVLGVGMILLDDLVGFVGDFPGVLHIRVCESGVDEVVVVRGEEHAALDAFRNPFLMQDSGGALRPSVSLMPFLAFSSTALMAFAFLMVAIPAANGTAESQ